MISKIEIFQHVYHIVKGILVLFTEMIENSNFDQSLMMKSFLVSYDFYSNVLIRLVIECSNHLTKATLSDYFEDFVSV